jgi:hypothetical protein
MYFFYNENNHIRPQNVCVLVRTGGWDDSEDEFHVFLLFRMRKMCYTKAYIELLVETDEDSFCGTLIR